MPRGSKPGERRGGRQKGTPNKKTLLRNAALCAAAADPNHSPLDYLLKVMREQALPLETRIAAAREALPYFHSRPQEAVARQTRQNGYGHASSNGNGDRSSGQSINVRIFKGGSDSEASEGEPRAAQSDTHDTSQSQASSNATAGTVKPLEFLLAVMRDPDTPANLRLRIASLASSYVHPKRSTDGASKIVVDDPTGFSIDAALAMELRDAERRYHFVCITQISQPEHYKREAAALENRIEEIKQGLQCPCPSRYGKDQRKRDQERLKELGRVRDSGLKLSKHEDVEEAWLTARVASWGQAPEWVAQARLRELDGRRWDEPWNHGPPLTLRERAEFRALQTTYADEVDMTLLGASNFQNLKDAMMQSTFSKYPLIDDVATNPNPRRAAIKG